jgi:hypothetical protein
MAPPRIKLGELLVKANVVTEAQLKTALQEQQKWGGKLGEILVRMSYLTEDILVKALCKQLGLPRADLARYPEIPKSVLARVPPAVAREFNVLPLAATEDGKSLAVCVSDPLNLQMLDELRSVTGGTRIVTYVAGASEIGRAIARHYEGAEVVDDASVTQIDVIDALGRAVDRTPMPQNVAGLARSIAAAAPPAPLTNGDAHRATAGGSPARAMNGKATPSQLLDQIEEMQQREVTALKALVEILIDKGVFSREEYLARVRR